jgi:hypothetical protein
LRFGDFADRRRIETGGVVDEIVEAAERLHGILDEAGEISRIQQIALHQHDRGRPRMREVVLQRPRLRSRRAIVHHEVRPGPVEPPRDRAADAACAARDEYDFSFERSVHWQVWRRD